MGKARLNDDKRDPEILANLLGSDMMCESFVPDRHSMGRRNMAGTRLGCVRDTARHRDNVRAILARYDHGSLIRTSLRRTRRKLGKDFT